MDVPVTLDAVCVPSGDVVARQIEGSILIIPVVAGIVEVEGELFALDATGRAIWEKLDGQRTLKDVAALIADEFSGPRGAIESAVVMFADELTRRRLLVAQHPSSTT